MPEISDEKSKKNKLKNKKRSSIKKIITISTIILIIILTIDILLRVITTKVFNYIDRTISSYTGVDKVREEIYNNIISELSNNNIISNELKNVGNTYGWETECADYYNKYYFYINNKDCEQYKVYWLEGVEKEYKKGYNKELSYLGDYVFYVVNIRMMSYNTDISLRNAVKNKNIKCEVNIYNQSLYYRYISDYKDENNFSITDDFKCGDMIDRYVFYIENEKLVYKKVNDN